MLLRRTEAPPRGSEWSYELKYDGWRAIVEARRGAARIWSRNGYDITAKFPELSGVHRALPACVLDCELVVLDENGHPRFEWMHRRKRPPATLVAFDVLRLQRAQTLELPLEERRAMLEGIVPADTPALLRARTFSDGHALLAACEERGLEGIVAKRARSRYHPGARTDAWLKIRTACGRALIAERLAKRNGAA